ncbi:spore coat protein GerQ [Paenibacillus dokdonensis]|uniref:Spore coat protein GerQ n=1 Tax=Paenibacillus dokdonensis TaxID=2567944 RepID=A0ABU6GIQ1_9BACL|nr:spore coat protein GerQ [Paenibacillus dokdonensis]MEC0239629.1 spore coat protein GerQ [Paenibacillus dokdonensis]
MMPQPFRPATYNMGNGYPGLSGGGQGMPGSMTMGSMGGMGSVPPQVTSGSPMGPMGTVMQAPQQPQFEQSYIENILRLNLGKTGTFYMTYENNSQWNAKVFTGVIEAAGRDHIIISERSTGQRIVLLTLNLDYITFNEPLIYQYPGVIGNPGQGR